jgi:hypothetical protein
LKKLRICPIDHLLCCPGIAPSNFYLFEKLEIALAQEFQSTEEHLLVIRGVTDSVEWAELESAFEAWEGRLSDCIQVKGEYNISMKIHILIARLRCERITGHSIPKLKSRVHVSNISRAISLDTNIKHEIYTGNDNVY